MRSRHHEPGAGHHRGIRQAPRVGVEHRHDRQHGVRLAESHPRGRQDRERVKHERAVRVDDALRLARRARGVAHGRGGPLVGIRRRRPSGRRPRASLRSRRHPRPASLPAPTTITRLTFVLRRDLLPQRQQRFVHQDDAIVGVVDDEGELVGMQAEVQRVEHGARHRHAEVRLEVLMMIPRERRHAIARPDAQRAERAGQPPRPRGEVARMCSDAATCPRGASPPRGADTPARRAGRPPTASAENPSSGRPRGADLYSGLASGFALLLPPNVAA